MQNHRKRKQKAGPARNAPPLEPLDDAQLNVLIRSVFAWMTVGFGITATVASAMLVSPIYPDLAGMIFIILAHLTIAFTLDRKLRRFSPTQAGAFFLFYAALTGFTLSVVFFMLFYPTVSSALVNASTCVGCLFGLMTLLGWGTRLDFSRGRSYVLMALLGLLIAHFVNRLLTGDPFDYIFSFFSVLLFSALAACHPINALSTDLDLRIKPADSLRFSLLAALQLYVAAGNLIAIALSSNLPGSRGLRYDQRHPHQQSHYSGIGASGFGSGGSGIGSGGGGGSMGGGGSVGGGAGGGGSFSP